MTRNRHPCRYRQHRRTLIAAMITHRNGTLIYPPPPIPTEPPCPEKDELAPVYQLHPPQP